MNIQQNKKLDLNMKGFVKLSSIEDLEEHHYILGDLNLEENKDEKFVVRLEMIDSEYVTPFIKHNQDYIGIPKKLTQSIDLEKDLHHADLIDDVLSSAILKVDNFISNIEKTGTKNAKLLDMVEKVNH